MSQCSYNIFKIKFTEMFTESTILQLIGFFVLKEPINSKFVDLTLLIYHIFYNNLRTTRAIVLKRSEFLDTLIQSFNVIALIDRHLWVIT